MLDGFKLLEKYKVGGILPYRTAQKEEDVIKKAREIGFPVALKVLSKEIIHKTDVGGVWTGLRNAEEVRIAYRRIMQIKRAEGVFIQKMARKGIELIIGGMEDPQFGNMILLGLGGIYVEIFKDISARICPINQRDVNEMVEELKAHPIIRGSRGRKGIHMKSLKNLLFKVCEIMKKEKIKEMDINPVVFDSKGYDIVDVRIIR